MGLMPNFLLVLVSLSLTVLGLYLEVPCPVVGPEGTLPADATGVARLFGWSLAWAPWTLQTLGPWTAGMMLGPRTAAISQALWLLACLIGAPWAESSSGFGMVESPAFGFQAGFVAQAFIVASIARGGSPRRRFLALAVGQASGWGSGALWLALQGVPPWPILAGQASALPGMVLAWGFLAVFPWVRGRSSVRRAAPPAHTQVIR